MRFTISSGLLGVLATLSAISYGQEHITVAPRQYNKLLPRATTKAAATTTAQVCKRDVEERDYSVVRESTAHQWGKRVEKNIPGKLTSNKIAVL